MPHKINVNKFIAEFHSTRLFHKLTLDEAHSVLDHSISILANEGEQLVCEGEEPTNLLFVIEGTLITSRTNIYGDEVAIRLLGKGDCCMDAVIFMGGKSPIAVRAVSQAKILKIPVHIVKQLAEENIHFSNSIIRVLAYFYKESMLQIDNLAIKDSKTRLGYYLLRSHLEKPHTTVFQLKFKKTIIANYLGITPETFSRMLKEMQKKNTLLTVDQANITLSNSKSLCQFCDAATTSACHKVDKADCGR